MQQHADWACCTAELGPLSLLHDLAIDRQDPPVCSVKLIATLQELVNDVHCIIEAMIGRESDVKLLRPSTEAVPEFVMGDPDRLKGVLLNLYTNAGGLPTPGWGCAGLSHHLSHLAACVVHLACEVKSWRAQCPGLCTA